MLPFEAHSDVRFFFAIIRVALRPGRPPATETPLFRIDPPPAR